MHLCQAQCRSNEFIADGGGPSWDDCLEAIAQHQRREIVQFWAACTDKLSEALSSSSPERLPRRVREHEGDRTFYYTSLSKLTAFSYACIVHRYCRQWSG